MTVSSTVPYTAVDATGAAFSSRGALTPLGPRAVPEGGSAPDAGERAARHPARRRSLRSTASYSREARARAAGCIPPRRTSFRSRTTCRASSQERSRSAGRPRCSSCTGGCGALVCAGESREGEAVRPLLRRAQPGLPRRVRGEVLHHEGGYGHGRRGRALRREGRNDVLLLDPVERRRRRRLRLRGSLPPVAAGPMGQGLAVPPLGPGRPRRGDRAGQARRHRARPRRDGIGDTVRTWPGSFSRRQRAPRRSRPRSSERRSACARRGSRLA